MLFTFSTVPVAIIVHKNLGRTHTVGAEVYLLGVGEATRDATWFTARKPRDYVALIPLHSASNAFLISKTGNFTTSHASAASAQISRASTL